MLLWAAIACRFSPSEPADPTPRPPGDSSPVPADTTDTSDTSIDTGTPTPAPPVVILVYVDDQGANTLWAMETLLARLAPESVRFGRAYTNVPLCCPARASLLSGGWYPKDTRVLSNDVPNGGVWAFDTSDTLATRLQSAGFATALLGKYLNQYEDGVAPEVPPGWDLFLAGIYEGTGYDHQVVRGSSGPDASTQGAFEDTGGEYLTYFLFDEALAFLDAHPDEPVFVLLSVMAPHLYATPADEDLGTWSDWTPESPSFNEEDVSDKPGWLSRADPLTDAQVLGVYRDARQLMENLEAVDRSLGTLLDGLEARGLADRATVIYASDNGYLHGEHRLTSKGVPYEEALRVPLYVRMPGIAPRDDDRLVSVNLDLPAMLLDVAGLPPTGEGVSLLDALADPELPLRDHLYVDNYAGSHPLWAGVVTDRWKYVEWSSGDVELYDLDADPYELASLHSAPPDEAEIEAWAALVEEHRAFAITTPQLPVGRVGEPYEETLDTWGGAPPVTFVLDGGTLPAGLVVEPDGRIVGTPTESGAFDVSIRATDGSVTGWTGAPQSWASTFTLTVGASATTMASRDGSRARFRVPARPGASVVVLAYADDTFDGRARASLPVVAGADGLAEVVLEGLDPARDAHWQVVVDGVRRPAGGRLPRATR
ncbi:MAG: sulfatase-like hydrolase/transferase [Myxococcota bacterium]